MDLPPAIEPTEWFVVFHRKSYSSILSVLAFGEFKHVSAFAYIPGYKTWLIYDVQWDGTRIMLVDKAAIMVWTEGCDILKISRIGNSMKLANRVGLYCVTGIQHLIGLKCVAVTPGRLYRHILRSGGVSIVESKQPASVAGRPDAGDRAAAGPE
jgi:hypothetical protein